MNEPWEQDGVLGDEDFAEGLDDEADELGVDFRTEDAPDMAPQPTPGRRPGIVPHTVPVIHNRPERPPQRKPKRGGKQKFRIRQMSPRMAARSQGVVSILITKTDGSQVLLVKKG